MWPDNRLCDLLNITHPIIQAPMVGSCSPALVAAVNSAGAFGSLGCGGKPIDKIRDEAAAIRRASNRGFNLNFFIRDAAQTDPEVLAAARKKLKTWYDKYDLGDPPSVLPDIGAGFDQEHLDLVLDIKPAVVSFHFGHPGTAVIDRLKDAGITLISTATNSAEARALEEAGIDAIIAQSWEAGGHRGSHKRTAPAEGIGGIALIPQIVDAVQVPVIAAGGIADGRGIAAAFALGAAGVQIGTAFLTCPEAATEEARRTRILNASDTDTMFTDAYSGRSARGMRSRFAQEMAHHPDPLPDFMHMYTLSTPIRQAAPDEDASFMLYGQSAAMNLQLPAGELVEKLSADALARLACLGGR